MKFVIAHKFAFTFGFLESIKALNITLGAETYTPLCPPRTQRPTQISESGKLIIKAETHPIYCQTKCFPDTTLWLC